jgi:hypothetical protein
MEDTTMKKIYMQPELEAIELKMNVTLLAGSDQQVHNDETVDDVKDLLGRENDTEW